MGGEYEWAVGTWERDGGVDDFSVLEDGTLNYIKANLNEIGPKTKGGDLILWSAQSILGLAEIKLVKLSESEARLVTQVSDMTEENTYTKKML